MELQDQHEELHEQEVGRSEKREELSPRKRGQGGVQSGNTPEGKVRRKVIDMTRNEGRGSQTSDAAVPMEDEQCSLTDGKMERLMQKLVLGVDVSEIFSPQRVTKMCEEFLMRPGSAMDLVTG